MDWEKVISALELEAKHQAGEGDKFRASQNMTARSYATGCGAAALTLTGLARALSAGLKNKGGASAS